MKKTLKAKNISNQFSFKTHPTMAAILKTQGQATVLIDEEEFKIIKESEFAQIKTKAVERAVEAVNKIVEAWDGSGNPNVQLALHDVLSELEALQKENK